MVFHHVFEETFYIFRPSIPRDIVVEIFYADLHREYIEWMEIDGHFISIPEVMFTWLRSLKVKKMQPFF